MKRLGFGLSIVLVALVLCFVAIMATFAKAAEDGSSKHYIYSLTGTIPYARFVNVQFGTVWDDNAGALAASPTWTDTDVALTTKMTTVGGWLVPVPASLPSGMYDLVIYDVSTAAGSRSNSDAVSGKSRRVQIKNGTILTLANP